MSRPSELAAQRARYAPVFSALGDPTRLALLAKLSSGDPCSIARLTDTTKLTRQAVTKHLKVLLDARLVHTAKAGRESRFAINPEPIEEARHYLELVSRQWDETLGRLRAFVER
jgi:DNA-binding transcriptional ArsR family regulator